MKAVLVIDMPNSCIECPLNVESVHCYDACCITGSKIISSYGKFPWCPLKPIPEKIEGDLSIKFQWGDYEDGWNNCIDIIVGE